MTPYSPEVDHYIAQSAPFARPVLQHLRQLVHTACPAVEEVIKWRFPNFMYHGILCSMASFKAHCAFTFWKGSLLQDKHGIIASGERTAMGSFGKITSLQDLPADDVLLAYIKEAAALNEQGARKPARTRPQQRMEVPEDFAHALHSKAAAAAVFSQFTYAQQKEYIDWINSAKTTPTRLKRIGTAVEWISEGKVQNWKYIKTAR